MDTRLIFVGLIAHVFTLSGVQRAVFVNAPMHEARIVVASSDVIEVQGLVEQASDRANERVFAIDNQHLVLESSATERPVAASSFAHYIPSLAAISDATGIRDEVEEGRLFEGAHAYLDLTGGTLSAEGDIQQVAFRGARSGAPRCVAMSVSYSVKTSGDSLVLRGAKGAFLRIRAGATARVVNEPPPAFTTPHYHMYSMILKDATHVASPRSTGRTCPGTLGDQRGKPGRQVSTNAVTTRPAMFTIDCSNSQYP